MPDFQTNSKVHDENAIASKREVRRMSSMNTETVLYEVGKMLDRNQVESAQNHLSGNGT